MLVYNVEYVEKKYTLSVDVLGTRHSLSITLDQLVKIVGGGQDTFVAYLCFCLHRRSLNEAENRDVVKNLTLALDSVFRHQKVVRRAAKVDKICCIS